VLTTNGKDSLGVLAEEAATSVTLRRDIDEMTASSKSLMPDGIEKEIGPQDMANLIGYLREALRSEVGGREVR
jgi:hypothetical protein